MAQNLAWPVPPPSQASTPLFTPVLQNVQITKQNTRTPQMPPSAKTNKIPGTLTSITNVTAYNFFLNCQDISHKL